MMVAQVLIIQVMVQVVVVVVPLVLGQVMQVEEVMEGLRYPLI
jgi:hypothetical protein